MIYVWHGVRGCAESVRLPNTTMLAVISDSIPVCDELCRRFLNFIFSCMNCGSELVRLFGLVQQACMKSSLGRNPRFCAVRFRLSASDIGQYKLNRTCFAGKFCIFFNDGFYGPSLFCL